MVSIPCPHSLIISIMNSSNSTTDLKSVECPSTRMKQLVEMSHMISVDRNISISKYFNSGRELIKSATALENKGDIERAFVLYLRYMTLFLEKLVHHPEYSKADRNEKILVKNECNRVFDLAEHLKERILQKYTEEYEKSNHGKDVPITDSTTITKRSIDHVNSSRRHSELEEIDKRFDFSQSVSNNDEQGLRFDPFNIEELKRSLHSD